MSSSNLNPDIKKQSFIKGLLLAAISVAISVAVYMINPVIVYTNFLILIGEIVLIIVLLIVFALDVRRSIGGYWSFKEAFTCFFIITLTVAIVSILYNFILMKFINPDLPKLANDAVAQSLTERLSRAHLSQEDIDKYTKQFNDGEFQGKLEPTLKNFVTNLGTSIIMYCVFSLILAAIFIKRKPAYLDVTDPTV